jgi:hypothetical protein
MPGNFRGNAELVIKSLKDETTADDRWTKAETELPA